MIILYRVLLYLFPASWRAEFGAEMERVFAARSSAAHGMFATLALWLETIPDLITNAMAVQWDVLQQDLRYVSRALRRAPAFTLATVLIAASGIGATTAAFTMVNHVFLRPFPFPGQDWLVKLRQSDLSGLDRFWDVSPANYRDWKTMSRSFQSMGAYRNISVNLDSGEGDPQRIEAGSFTADLLPTIGVNPILGRIFSAEDDRAGSPGTVILSYGLWHEQFGGDPAVLRRTIQLDNTPYTVIGVMPNGFYFPTRKARLWTTMRWTAGSFEDRSDTYIFPLGRLRPGVTPAQA